MRRETKMLMTAASVLAVCGLSACDTGAPHSSGSGKVAMSMETSAVEQDAGSTTPDASVQEPPKEADILPDVSHLTQEIPEGLLEAALAGLVRWEADLPPFSRKDEKPAPFGSKGYRLGLPYRECFVSRAYLKDPDFFPSELNCSDEWYFPLIRKEHVVVWLSVGKRKDEWKATGFGGAGSASWVATLEKELSLEKEDVGRYLLTLFGATSVSYVAIAPVDGGFDNASFYSMSRDIDASLSLDDVVLDMRSGSAANSQGANGGAL